jgi:hypothetical protein
MPRSHRSSTNSQPAFASPSATTPSRHTRPENGHRQACRARFHEQARFSYTPSSTSLRKYFQDSTWSPFEPAETRSRYAQSTAMPTKLPQVTILHLSDLHFGTEHRFGPPRTPSGEPGSSAARSTQRCASVRRGNDRSSSPSHYHSTRPTRSRSLRSSQSRSLEQITSSASSPAIPAALRRRRSLRWRTNQGASSKSPASRASFAPLRTCKRTKSLATSSQRFETDASDSTEGKASPVRSPRSAPAAAGP